MEVRELRVVVRDIPVARCVTCGSDRIKLDDCGYSSFNVGGGTCQDCGHAAQTGVGCVPSVDELAAIWNAANDIPTLIAREHAKIDASLEAIGRLEAIQATRSAAEQAPTLATL